MKSMASKGIAAFPQKSQLGMFEGDPNDSLTDGVRGKSSFIQRSYLSIEGNSPDTHC